jgi:hypothetical protein
MAITLKQAYEQGSLRIAFYCGAHPCTHVGKIDIRDAIARWGADRLLDQIPARCSKCGSSDRVSARGEPPGRLGKRGNR